MSDTSFNSELSAADLAPVFLIEDDDVVRLGCEQALALADMPVQSFADAESALAALSAQTPSVVVSDVRLPGRDGLAVLREMLRHDRQMPVILVTGHGDVSMAVTAMRAGAYDFIEKPFHSERLVDVVRRALEKRRLTSENLRLREALQGRQAFPLIGESVAMQDVRRLVAALAPTDADILVTGETGAGKEVLARAIHEGSRRRGPFVALNCAALPESVFESEMFGHEAGAFTGANRRRIGKMEYANGGTLFLDEIESMPLALQAKLLRALQERSIERLGSNASVPVDCRVVAAAKVDLKDAADHGAFRADLYYRLNVVSIALPPLRQRAEDIPLLMAHFLQQAALRYERAAPDWAAQDMMRWQHHDWPGNVRELKNVAERFCLGLDDGLVIPEASRHSLAGRMMAVERTTIEEALRATEGNVARTADLLAVPRKTLYDKLNRHGIEPERFRAG
ncbi:sigma-54-dependent transcriptional regulator [Ralstonia solanacearum]|uniref:sigma-54-dependent transcriptional regulator n=1 Tax=Ralstonia solanacearum TaxID=305 RepID=UPI0006DC3A0C|nr:sigma-54 dependent transcriptional regulator [Ralstonia solanacearum]